IDVAYRFFNTEKRKFIVADCPGHEQYTRNMVTGASTADLACILIDARKGVLVQTRRHSYLCHLIGIKNIVLAVNKMDLVDYSQEVFDTIKAEFQDFAAKLEITDLSFVPISALNGDNVVTRSTNMPWYEGASLLHMLEDVHIASDRNLIDSRFPVQYVIRPMSDEHHDYRGFAGTVAGGIFKVGDEVMVLPSGLTTKIAAIDTFEGPVDEAFPPMSVTIRLQDEIDTSRGSMICRVRNQPSVGQDIDAMICWMADSRPIKAGDRYTIKHTTQTGRAIIKEVAYQLDVNSLHRHEHPGQLNLNELGRITLRTTVPLFYDEYRRNRTTGSFILIDEGTNSTVGAGMILGAS
ncbi:MAG: sulfate adenylyltransferase, large subunit, partial [Ilumatobacteraceae bacterium]|nr:sulfate adenylyltransferase, large subunit [Ilumatobacteraceae bacterium]